MKNNNYDVYLIGYYENGEFWCASESINHDKSKEILKSLKENYPNRDYKIIKKVTSFIEL